ncbi:DUF2637 domain-containing protein [Pseudoclavibacter sp. VKM Ac-2867]|uniref:DUF2637 domain-containing protein n=1 Tax=Pseudoclavibacter sp. VKM Ac-2867 TaxID=2783829 RepID=UPI00188D360B|nr:DUF2637 domain-containing protein [Pseudoclavibacter sp. VKM Ac-2867]MBF4459458.1 DUF2637 domain-containing protein [Pseudoclavibacter sp. VKM Ac-2867]
MTTIATPHAVTQYEPGLAEPTPERAIAVPEQQTIAPEPQVAPAPQATAPAVETPSVAAAPPAAPAAPSKVLRAARISPDRYGVGAFAILLIIMIMGASYVFSYAAIAEAAIWTGIPSSVQWLAPVFIDGAILGYTLSLAILRWRRESVMRTMLVLCGFTAVSVAINFAHAASYWEWDFTQREAWFGALIAVGAPLAALFSAEEITRLIFTPPSDRDETGEQVPDAEAAIVETAQAEVSDPEPTAQTTPAEDHAAVEDSNEPGRQRYSFMTPDGNLEPANPPATTAATDAESPAQP